MTLVNRASLSLAAEGLSSCNHSITSAVEQFAGRTRGQGPSETSVATWQERNDMHISVSHCRLVHALWQGLCQEVMESYGGNPAAAAHLKQHYGFGWQTEAELAEYARHTGG